MVWAGAGRGGEFQLASRRLCLWPTPHLDVRPPFFFVTRLHGVKRDNFSEVVRGRSIA